MQARRLLATAAAAATIASPSARLVAIGFCTDTALPAASAAKVRFRMSV